MEDESGSAMRFVLFATALGIALGAEGDPREIVRRSLLNDEAGKPAMASDYCFTERTRTETLGQDGQVRAVSVRTRDMCASEFQRRRERYRKAIREIPDAFLFRLAGVEQVNSRPAFVIEATPRAGYQPVDRYSKLYTQLRAKLWIDQADSRWVKIEAELLDTVNIGWILLRVHKGSRVRLTQERINAEVWLPAETWYRVSVRIGLISARILESETVCGDYKLKEPPADPLAAP